MTTAQYKALESHISFWGALIMFGVTESKWVKAGFFVVMVLQVVRNLYWYKEAVKERK